MTRRTEYVGAAASKTTRDLIARAAKCGGLSMAQVIRNGSIREARRILDSDSDVRVEGGEDA